MNRKNTFIAIGVIGIGFILYKLLIGFVLPITLLVSLGYVLKFLLKGSESEPENDSVNEVSQILTNNEPPSSIQDIVEIKPIEEDKSVEGVNFSEEDKSEEGVNSSEEDKSEEGVSPNKKNKPFGV